MSRKHRTKALSALLAGIVIPGLLLTGCSSSDTAADDAEKTEAVQTEEETEETKADEADTDSESEETVSDADAVSAVEPDQEEQDEIQEVSAAAESVSYTYSLDSIPEYSGEAYVVLNDNIPDFEGVDASYSYETYGSLDSLGRCTAALANIGQDLMPTEKRESISSVKPTGWVNNSYDFVDGKVVYNRCHLIGFQLTGENANANNLITGTRYMNVDGMLPFENMTADYIKETENHVLYRVTPLFDGDNLVANGVVMEARSVEDDGEGIEFCVFCYNVQPGVTIDYATGDNWADGSVSESSDTAAASDSSASDSSDITQTVDVSQATYTYVLNTSTMKFHKPTCSSVDKMAGKNKLEYTGTREEVIAKGYEPCKNCNP